MDSSLSLYLDNNIRGFLLTDYSIVIIDGCCLANAYSRLLSQGHYLGVLNEGA